MAVSGSFSKTFGRNNKYQVLVKYEETDIDTSACTSKVKVSVYVQSLGSGYTIVASATKTTTVTINGTKYSFTHSGLNLSANGSVLMGSVTSGAIAHSTSDGSKSIDISVTQEINVHWVSNDTYTYNVSLSKTGIALTKIPRASAMALASGSSTNMGSSLTLNVTRYSTAYTNTITWKFGSSSGTLCTNSTASSLPWSIPLDLASQVPNATSGTCTFTCNTYSGSTLIGTSTLNVTLYVPSSVVPSISSVVISDSKCGGTYGFLQNYCTANIKTTYAMAYSATMKSISVSMNGETLSGANVTTQVLKNSGTMTATVTLTDSRGRTATKTASITVLPYETPSFDVEVDRCDEDGEWYAGGEYVKISGSITAYDVEGLSKSMTVSNGTDTQTVTLTGTDVDIIMPCDTDNRVTITMSLSDGLATTTKEVIIESTVSWVDFGSDGVAATFGGKNENTGQDTFKIPVEFKDTAFANGYKLFYIPGDSWAEQQPCCLGHVTNAQTDINFLIPTIPILGNIRFASLKLCVRTPAGQYPWVKSTDSTPNYNQLDWHYLEVISDGAICIENTFEYINLYRKSGGIHVAIRCKNKILAAEGGDAITNNTPLAVMVDYTAECY